MDMRLQFSAGRWLALVLTAGGVGACFYANNVVFLATGFALGQTAALALLWRLPAESSGAGEPNRWLKNQQGAVVGVALLAMTVAVGLLYRMGVGLSFADLRANADLLWNSSRTMFFLGTVLLVGGVLLPLALWSAFADVRIRTVAWLSLLPTVAAMRTLQHFDWFGTDAPHALFAGVRFVVWIGLATAMFRFLFVAWSDGRDSVFAMGTSALSMTLAIACATTGEVSPLIWTLAIAISGIAMMLLDAAEMDEANSATSSGQWLVHCRQISLLGLAIIVPALLLPSIWLHKGGSFTTGFPSATAGLTLAFAAGTSLLGAKAISKATVGNNL